MEGGRRRELRSGAVCAQPPFASLSDAEIGGRMSRFLPCAETALRRSVQA